MLEQKTLRPAFACPAGVKDHNFATDYHGYGINETGYSSVAGGTIRTLHSCKEPSSLLDVGDCSRQTSTNVWPKGHFKQRSHMVIGTGTWRHNNGANLAFADGHVEARRKGKSQQIQPSRMENSGSPSNRCGPNSAFARKAGATDSLRPFSWPGHS